LLAGAGKGRRRRRRDRGRRRASRNARVRICARDGTAGRREERTGDLSTESKEEKIRALRTRRGRITSARDGVEREVTYRRQGNILKLDKADGER